MLREIVWGCGDCHWWRRSKTKQEVGSCNFHGEATGSNYVCVSWKSLAQQDPKKRRSGDEKLKPR